MAQSAWTGLQESTARLPGLGLGMMAHKENLEQRNAGMALQQDRYASQQMHQKVLEENAKQQLAAQEAKLPAHIQPMDPNMILQSKVAAKKAYGDAGLKAWSPLYDAIGEIVQANPKSTKGDAYKAALSAYPSIREQMMESLEKELTSGKLDPLHQQRLEQVYNSIAYDKTGENVLGNGVFSNTARSMKMEEENSKGAVNAARQEAINERSQRVDTRIRELAEENNAIKRERENRLGSPKPEKDKPPKPPSTTDIARVKKMIQEAGGDPSADDITLIQEAANAIGYDYVNVPGGKRGVPGIDADWANWKDKDTWKLVPKSGAATYKSADEVKAAFQSGKLSEAEATKILQGQFGYK